MAKIHSAALRYAGRVVFALAAGACAPATTTSAHVPPVSAASASVVGRSSAPVIPGIPTVPNVVAVAPFQVRLYPSDSAPRENEQTDVIIAADVDGWHGYFLVDLGDPDFSLNSAYLRGRPTGGVDTVTDANQTAPARGREGVHITLRVGTVVDDFAPGKKNAWMYSNFDTKPAVGSHPLLGQIGLPALEPFETIVDYSHQRLVLIRLDSAGHRLADVPAYTPVWSAPLIDAMDHWGVSAMLGDVPDTLVFDTGDPINDVSYSMRERLGKSIKKNRLDSLTIAGRAFHQVLMGRHPDAPGYADLLGFPFLSSLGVVGFNHRTHQFILYK